jgi:hypothetical protein
VFDGCIAISDTRPDVSAGPTILKETDETLPASIVLFSWAQAEKVKAINKRLRNFINGLNFKNI